MKIKFIDIVKYNEITLEKFFKKFKILSNPKLKDIHNINNWIDNNIF